MESKRRYLVIIFTRELPSATHQELSLEDIMNPKPDGKDWEYKYALDELAGIDTVMDLQIMDILPFQANRDSKEDKGILIRIS